MYKKLIIFLLFICLTTVMVVSCNKVNNIAENETELLSDSIKETSIDGITTLTTESFESSETINNQNNGGTNVCSVHAMEYHFYSMRLINYIGNENFQEWKKVAQETEPTPEGDCPVPPHRNIYECIHYFNVPKEVMIEIYNIENLNINIDLLYGGTAEQNEAYYRDINGITDEYEKERLSFELLKHKIPLPDSASEKDPESTPKSLVEYMYLSNISIDELKKIVNDSRQNKLEAHKNEENYTINEFNYNFDFMEGLNPDEIKELIDTHSWYYLDCLVCGLTPYESRYEQQCAQNVDYFAEHNITFEQAE